MRYFLSKQKYWIAFLFLGILSFATNAYSATYHITSAADWKKYADLINAQTTNSGTYRAGTYELDADIDFSETKFVPFGAYKKTGQYTGSSSYYFNGVFHGNGHVLKNIKTFDYPTNKAGLYYGIFACSKGSIQDLIVDGLSMESIAGLNGGLNSAYSAGICGYMMGGTITNCAVLNSYIYAGVGSTGGIAGYNNGGSITNCIVNKCTFANPASGVTNIGGIVGYVGAPSQIANCFVNADFPKTQMVTGGIAGRIYYKSSNQVTLKNCYATGSFSFSTSASNQPGNNGGLVGYMCNTAMTNCGSSISISINLASFTGSKCLQKTAGAIGFVDANNTINDSYATGDISFTGSMDDNQMAGINSFYGQTSDGVAISLPANCYSGREYYNDFLSTGYNKSAAGIIYGAPATLIGKDTMQSACLGQIMNKNMSAFLWNQNDNLGNGYPVPFVKCYSLLKLMVQTGLLTAEDTTAFETVEPSCVKDENEFHITTAADMNDIAQKILDNPADWSVGKKFIVDNDITDAVGSVIGTESHPFKGSFDGQSYTINMAVDGEANQGVIGYADGSAKITNVNVAGSVNGTSNVGGIVGSATADVTISNCSNGAEVSATSGNAGGIVGTSTATISGCMNVANVTGTSNVGGIAGSAASVTDCANMGYIDGPATSTGGIAGTATSVTRCLSAGYTLGSAIATKGTCTSCYFDPAIVVNGVAGSGVEAVTMSSSSTFGTLTANGWKGVAGSYPVPSSFSGTTIGNLATPSVYFVGSTKANAVSDSILATKSVWTNSNADVITYNVSSFLPIAAGTATLSITNDGITRNLPITVTDPGLFSGGFGNVLSHFIIKKNADLNSMADYVSNNNGAEGCYFELANDITDGPFVNMIGNSTTHFKGNFFSTTGSLFNIPLAIENSTTDPCGLIGYNSGNIERISVTGSVTDNGKSGYVGGLAGYSDGKITNCVNDADIKATNGASAAGVCGGASGSISNSTNIGRVSSVSGYAAGIATSNQSALQVSNCYNGGMVTAANAAGIVAMTGGDSKVTPVISNNVNVAAVNGSTASDALVYANAAAPSITGGLYDTQHSVAASTNSTAVADSSAKLVAKTVSGWTTSGSVYPQNNTFSVATVASAPVFLNYKDSATNVKHEFKLVTPAGVTWSATSGKVTISGNVVKRVAVGPDTLVAVMGNYSRCVPIYVDCIWTTVEDEAIDVCNIYGGKTYTKNTVLTVKDSTHSDDPNADCGTIHIKTVNVSVGTAGQTLVFQGCGSYTYDGVEYKKDTLFTNKSCDYVSIKVYPSAKSVDSVVTVPCTQLSYTYKINDSTFYTVERTSKTIVDSLIVVDTIKSTVCSCDSIYRNVRVSFPSFVTDSVVATTQCNTFDYTTFSGKKVSLGWNWDNYDPNGDYYEAGVYPVTYADTNFVAPNSKEYTEIRNLTVNIYRSKFMTESDHVGTDCTPVTYELNNGKVLVFDNERYVTNDTVFYDSIPATDFAGCYSLIDKITVRLKGLAETLDTVYIGAYDTPRCDSCSQQIILSQLKGDEYVDKGFCDKLQYKRYVTDRSWATRKASSRNVVLVSFKETKESCGYSIPYVFHINSSNTLDSLIEACHEYTYTTKMGKTFTVNHDTIFSDSLKGVVPGCGCDSIWNVTLKVYNPKYETADTVVCESYTYNYLDSLKGALTVLNDTVIMDTLRNHIACDTLIRTTNVTVHHAYPASVNTLVEISACQSYTYTSPVKGDIFCKVDTTFNDTLTTQYGCDSIVPVKISIMQPVVIDSTLHVCSDYTYKYHKVGGGTVVIPLGDNPAVLDSFLIEDVLKNADASLCDTVLHIQVVSHATRVVKPAVTAVCGYMEYTRFDGSTFPIESAVTVYDTLKSKLCDCDSIVRIDSFVVGEPYYPTADTQLDTTLYGCRFSSVLTYKRRSNAWNADTTISFTPVSSEVANQQGFINIVKASNPSVVKLDTVRERLTDGRVWIHYYWMAHDTMKSISGCDSVVPFRVEYDGQHTLGRHYYYVDHSYAPFTYNGITYQEPNFAKGVVSYDSIEVTLPSVTGGCDTSYFAMVKMYPCKVIDTTIHWCDKASFYDLHHNLITATSDTVYSDTLRYNITASDTARCDSVIKTWRVKIGLTTPASLIKSAYIGSCDEIVFHRTAPASNMVAEDTTFTESTMFRCHYINVDGCDSIVPIYATVHVTEPTNVYIHRTDYYQFKSLIDKSITRITSDTVITEKVPDIITVPMPNGDFFTCDSVIITNITIRPAEWRDTTIIGCDSVYTIASSSDSIRGTFDDMPKVWYHSSKKFDMPNAVNINPYYHVNIIVNKSASTSQTKEGCESVTYHNKVYKESTDLIERFTTIAGCDSIDTVHIVVHPVTYVDKEYTGCSFLYYGRGVYTADTVVYDTIRYKSGCNCDSVITTTNLVVYQPKQTEVVIDSCMFFTYPVLAQNEYNWKVRDTIFKLTDKDSVYTKSQSFYQYISEDTDENGCATIQHTTLQVNPCFPYPVIINKYNWILALNKDLLTKDVKADHITGYQWYKDGALLKGANQSYYTEDKRLEGCYQVHVLYGDLEFESENICIDPSMEVDLDYDLYPDPVALGNKVSIKCNFSDEGATAEIYSTLGVKVYNGTANITKDESIQLPYAFGSAGNYFLKITTSEGTVLGKKFIVK